MKTATADPMETPTAAVIIPHYNDVVRLDRCLSALMSNDLNAVEVIVVDNGSTQDLGPVTRTYPQVRFVSEAEKGAAAARNRGVRETTAPRLFFLDADCVPEADWVSAAHQFAPEADLIGGRIDVFDETPAPRSGAEGFETVFAFHNRDYVEKKGFTVTANLLTTRVIFEEVGDFHGGVSEDYDWCQRAQAKGYRLVYRDGLRVSHPSRSDWSALKKKWRRMTKEMFGLTGPGPQARLKWALRGVAMPLSAIAHLPKIWTSAQLNGAGERLRASGTLIRLRLTRMAWMLRQACGGQI